MVLQRSKIISWFVFQAFLRESLVLQYILLILWIYVNLIKKQKKQQ